jgi:SPP1 family predicted phage head-tail adaptor
MSTTKTLPAGKLRHRITIERKTHLQDPTTGSLTPSWSPVAQNIHAAVEPLSGREFIAAAQTQNAISARITIRYRDGILPSMRVVHGTTVYNIIAVIPDPNTGREWLTLMVESE